MIDEPIDPPDGNALDPDLVIIHEASPASVNTLLLLLTEAGYNPLALDQPTGSLQYASGWTCSVRIAVPSDEAEGAGAVVAKWEGYRESEVEVTAREIQAHAILAIIPAVILGVILYLCTEFTYRTLCALVAVWAISFVIIANLLPTSRK